MKLSSKKTTKNVAVSKEDIIRYVYHETSPIETKQIQNAILLNAELEQLFYELIDAKKIADKALQKPKKSVIENILAYSKSTYTGKDNLLSA